MHASDDYSWPAWSWAALAVIGAIDLLWLSAGPVSLDAASTASIAGLGVFAVALHSSSTVRRTSAWVQVFVFGLAFMLIAWPTLRLFNYASMSLALPLADARLAHWDAVIGFDWLAYVRALDTMPWLLVAMDVTYQGLTAYSLVMFCIVLGVFGPARAREFVLVFFVAALLAMCIGMLFPAQAAMAHFRPDPEQFRHIGSDSGLYHLEPLALLRSHTPHTLSLHNLPGLVTFPSFHTAMGVIGILACRGVPPLLIASLLVNGVMIAGTPVFGSHYIVDVVAGVGLALAAFKFVSVLEARGGRGHAAPVGWPVGSRGMTTRPAAAASSPKP